MAEWIYFLHAPRSNFATTMSDDEADAFAGHARYIESLLAQGALILAGPTLGVTNTGVAIFEAVDEATALAIMNDDPAISSGTVTGELRPFRVSYLRGRS